MKYYFSPTIDLFHFLADRLEMTPESERLENKFKKYYKEHPDDYDLSLMEDFADEEKDPGTESYTENSYNNPDCDLLSQGIQYSMFEKDGHYFILLQTHNGCDMRGGYTIPYVFEIPDEASIMDNTVQAYLKSNPDKFWISDDAGENWYLNGDGNESGTPEDWDITEKGIFYKPTGEPISFTVGSENVKQWWEKDPKYIARWNPTLDKKQKRLKA